MEITSTKIAALFIVHLTLISVGPTLGIKWLSLLKTASIGTINTADLCDSIKGLNKRQIQICKNNVDLMDAVRFGADLAIHECQYQFHLNRWNCSTINGNRVFGKLTNEGTRESAFIHAITSAGVAHAVTKACSSGQFMRCGCDKTNQGPADGFQWSGCSDNTEYGTAFSKTFVDARDAKSARNKKPSAKALMNLHNNEVGRKTILKNMKMECKCHGVSGSCELKTCWRSMPSFRQIGEILKDKFNVATEVYMKLPPNGKGKVALVPKPENLIFKPSAKANTRSQKTRKRRVNSNLKSQEDTDLVYLQKSPNFCEQDDGLGSPGTRGRVCKPNSTDIDSCEQLCCGRGFRTSFRLVRERCRCKFNWCCFVECKECKREIQSSVCV